MSNDAFRWQTLERDALPETLFGQGPSPVVGRLTISSYDLERGLVAVGMLEGQRESTYSPPSLIVVEDKVAAEIFSWLKVYAPETSPLSQFARVVLASDWERFGSHGGYNVNATREDRWASVVVGEALAQGDIDVELEHMPLSRAAGCFSTTMARAAVIYGNDEATRACAERLRLLEVGRRFVRRPVSVNDLLPIWAIVGSRLNEFLSATEAATLVLDIARDHSPGSARSSSLIPSNLQNFPGLASDSIEERVVSFQRLAGELTYSAERTPGGYLDAVILAAAAFLVGRSTTHAFLLRRAGKTLPTASVWFGLIAALAGPRSWDPKWTRAAKGIERQIRPKFDWTESVGFDLCWAEFAWLAAAFEGEEVFGNLPKLLPKVLSIEVIPGATCQLRLAVGETTESERVRQEPSTRERELQAALSQFIGLAVRMRGLLETPNSVAQQSLGLEDGSVDGKRSRAKRVKRGGDDSGI